MVSRLACAFGSDTDTAAALAADARYAAVGGIDVEAWQLPHLGAPLPRLFREAEIPVLGAAVPRDHDVDHGRVLQ